jgi:GNAT superfamily N-acetyltransferase
MNYQIKLAKTEDFQAVLDLVNELAAFVHKADSVKNTVVQMEKDQELFTCFMAVSDEGETLGIAFIYFAYSTWVGKMLYLEDLVVREEYRRNGIGKALLNKVFEYAREQDCKRVRWQALEWNKPALNFYRSVGAVLDTEILNCDFEEEQVNSFNI